VNFIHGWMGPPSIILLQPEDEAFLKISQGAIVTEATLPSGYKVPSAPEGMDWVVQGGRIVQERKEAK
jgi:hypothetical protein